MTPIPAQRERAALADLFQAVGPDHPTLCEGWTTRDLAAHLVVRERRVDAMAGILAGQVDHPVADRLERRHADLVARVGQQDWPDLVATVRSGPPRWSPQARPSIDAAVNTAEFFVHHEDVRRAREDWEPRDLDDDLADALDQMLDERVEQFAASAPDGLLLVPDGRPPIVARRALPMVEVHGPIGELVLFLFGRGDHARIDVQVPDHATREPVDRLLSASWGV